MSSSFPRQTVRACAGDAAGVTETPAEERFPKGATVFHPSDPLSRLRLHVLGRLAGAPTRTPPRYTPMPRYRLRPASACGAVVSQIGSCNYRTSRRPRPVFDLGRTLVPRFLVAAIKLQDAGTHGEQNQSGQLQACIFLMTWPRWALIVHSKVPRSAVICLFSWPETTCLKTSRSRAVSRA